MDKIDYTIIDILERDGRIANVELADQVGLSPGSCLRRVKRLEADGVIRGYAAELDPSAVGRAFKVLLDIELTDFSHENVLGFEEALSAFDEVVEMHRLFGTPDYFVRVAVADLPAFETFLTEHILTIPGIQKLNSRFSMKTIK